MRSNLACTASSIVPFCWKEPNVSQVDPASAQQLLERLEVSTDWDLKDWPVSFSCFRCFITGTDVDGWRDAVTFITFAEVFCFCFGTGHCEFRLQDAPEWEVSAEKMLKRLLEIPFIEACLPMPVRPAYVTLCAATISSQRYPTMLDVFMDVFINCEGCAQRYHCTSLHHDRHILCQIGKGPLALHRGHWAACFILLVTYTRDVYSIHTEV